MQQEEQPRNGVSCIYDPIDLSISMETGPNGLGVSRLCLLGTSFYAGHIDAYNGFFSQKVLIRIVSPVEIQRCSQFSSSQYFSNQMFVELSSLKGEFLETLKKEQKFPFLSREDQSVLDNKSVLDNNRNEESVFIHLIDYGLPLKGVLYQDNQKDILEKFIKAASFVLDNHKVSPDSMNLESFVFQSTADDYEIKWIPALTLSDLYTDRDIASLLANLSFSIIQIVTCIECPSFQSQYFDLIDKISMGDTSLLEDVGMNSFFDFGDSGEMIGIEVLSACINFGVPFMKNSYFDGSCSISEALNKLSFTLYSFKNTVANGGQSSNRNSEELVEILSNVIDDEKWISEVVFGLRDQDDKGSRSHVSKADTKLGHKVDDTVVLNVNVDKGESELGDALDATLIIGAES